MPELAELDYDYTLHQRERAGDEKLYVRFFMDVVPDPEASKEAGMRKFRDAEMIQIQVPGDKRNIVVREVRDDDRERFEEKYTRFKAGEAEQTKGFPLREWSLVTRAMVEELKYLGFYTVENVAQAGEGALGKYPGLRELQRRAQAWLESQQSAAPLERLQSELQSRDEQIAALRASLEAQAKELAAMKKAA